MVGIAPLQTQFNLTAGRLLKFSPDWPCSDARVVFDCLSGDYWVISHLAKGVLESLQRGGKVTFDQLAQTQLAEQSPPTRWHETLELTLRSLVNAGLLVDTRGPTATAVLDDCAIS